MKIVLDAEYLSHIVKFKSKKETSRFRRTGQVAGWPAVELVPLHIKHKSFWIMRFSENRYLCKEDL